MPSRRHHRGSATRRLSDSFAATARRDAVFVDIRHALAEKDAEGLRLAVLRADEDRIAINRETVWRLTAAENDPALLDVLWVLDENSRDIDRLIVAGWQGAIIHGADAAMTWLDDILRPGLSLDQTAALAGLALRYNPALAGVLIQPVRDMPVAQQIKKDGLLMDYLHAAAANGQGEVIKDILHREFPHRDQVFSAHGGRYQPIVMRAVKAENTAALPVLLQEGQGYLSDPQMDQLLVAACDGNRAPSAALLVQNGASPLAMGAASHRHVARYLVYETGSALLRALLPGGVDAEKIYDKIRGEAPDTPTADAAVAQARGLIEPARQAELAFFKASMVLRDTVLRLQPARHQGRYESHLHRAARHGVLAQALAQGLCSPLAADNWRAKNAAGQSVMDLVIASGDIKGLLKTDSWQPRALQAFMQVLPNDALSPLARAQLMQQVQQADAAARDARMRYRL